MNQENRQFILDQLNANANPNEKEIARLAQELLHFQAEREVRAVVGQHQAHLAAMHAAQQHQWFPFLAPMPKGAKPTVVSESDTGQMLLPPVRQSYKVRLVNLQAFCAEHHLDYAAMYQVGMGEQEEHRGWVRCPWSLGVAFEMGQPFKQPRPVAVDPDDLPRNGGKRTYIQSPTQPEPITY